MAKTPQETLDLRGLIPPLSLLKLTQAFRQLPKKSVLEVLGKDPDTWTDLFKVLPEGTFDVLGVQGKIRGPGGFRVRIQKK